MAKAAEDVKEKGKKAAQEDSSDSEELKKKGSAAEETEEEETEDPDEESSEESSEETSKTDEEDSEEEESEEEGEKKDEKHEEHVPYSRFKDVNDRLRTSEERGQRLEEELGRSRQKKTWDDLTVEELKNVRKKALRDEDHELVEFLEDKIIDRKAEAAADKRFEKEKFSKDRVESWTAVVSDYPDLRKEDSVHYQRTADLVKSDPRFARTAEGHAIAARLVAEQMLRERLRRSEKESHGLKKKIVKSDRKSALEGESRPGKLGTTQNIDKLLSEAEASGDPYGAAWRKYLKAVEDKDRSSSKEV